MKDRTSFEIEKLERTEQVIIEEPEIAFEYLQLELDKQSTALGITKSALKKSDRFILTHNYTAKNTSCLAFNGHLGLFLKKDLAVDYTTSSIFHTSAVYAFKAGCDLQSVASIVSFGKALNMFRNPTKYDCFQPRESRSVNDYFDMLNFGEEPTIN